MEPSQQLNPTQTGGVLFKASATLAVAETTRNHRFASQRVRNNS